MRVAYEDVGTGLPIVFIPGLVGTKEWFTYQFIGLREKYRVISYDLRPAHSTAAYTLDLLTNDLARLIAALKLEPAVIVGHCFGGMIAQNIAITHHDQVDALILISAFPTMNGATREQIIEWMSPGEIQLETTFQTMLKRLFHTKPRTIPENAEGLDWLAAHSAQMSRTTLDARIGLVQSFDSSPWLSDIEAPTLIITGAQDQELFLTGAQALYEGIPKSELEVLEDGNHYCFYTRHDAVNGLIEDFLTEHLTEL